MRARRRIPARIRRRLDPAERFGLRLTLFGAAIALVAIPFATLLFEVLLRGPVVRLDARMANTLNDVVAGRGWAVAALETISWAGRVPFLVAVVVGALLHLLRRRQRRLAVFLVLTSFGGSILDTVVKAAVNRPRPVVDHPVATALGKSFPSGHAMSSLITYGALLLVYLPLVPPARRHATSAGVVVLVLAIGASRLLLGVHFLSDVLGGWILGLAWLLAAVAAFETWRHDEGRRRTHPLDEGIEPEAAVELR
jgi:undecaprenyl-diphosphatase